MNKIRKKPGVSIQRYIPVTEIRDDVVVLKDGGLRAALAVSSINFALKGEEEQNALISGYAQFLNGLDHPLQIVIQSRKLNIDEYLGRLERAQKEQTNELLRLQIADYRTFVRELVELGEIMSKRFFMVVPYSPVSDKKKTFWARFSEVLSPFRTIQFKQERFFKHKEALMRRLSHVQAGLSSLGLQSQLLDTQALIELYYGAYNPDIAETEKLQDVSKVKVEESYAV